MLARKLAFHIREACTCKGSCVVVGVGVFLALEKIFQVDV